VWTNCGGGVSVNLELARRGDPEEEFCIDCCAEVLMALVNTKILPMLLNMSRPENCNTYDWVTHGEHSDSNALAGY
jgi:hypothetical protein